MSYAAVTIRNYLVPLEIQFGDSFDPDRAIGDLIKAAEILKQEIKRLQSPEPAA